MNITLHCRGSKREQASRRYGQRDGGRTVAHAVEGDQTNVALNARVRPNGPHGPLLSRVRTATQLPESLDGTLRQFDSQPLAWQVASERRGLAGPEWSEIVDIPLLGL